MRIATIVLLLGAIANPQVSRLDLSAVADGDTMFYHDTVGTFETRLTLMRGWEDSVSGSYQYATQNQEVYLQSHPLPNGKLKIVESSGPNVATGKFVFEGTLGLHQLDGTWHCADGKQFYPVHVEKISVDSKRSRGEGMGSDDPKRAEQLARPFSRFEPGGRPRVLDRSGPIQNEGAHPFAFFAKVRNGNVSTTERDA